MSKPVSDLRPTSLIRVALAELHGLHRSRLDGRLTDVEVMTYFLRALGAIVAALENLRV